MKKLTFIVTITSQNKAFDQNFLSGEKVASYRKAKRQVASWRKENAGSNIRIFFDSKQNYHKVTSKESIQTTLWQKFCKWYLAARKTPWRQRNARESLAHLSPGSCHSTNSLVICMQELQNIQSHIHRRNNAKTLIGDFILNGIFMTRLWVR